jgi:hypothetical protein
MNHSSKDMAELKPRDIVLITFAQAVLFTLVGLGLWWLSGRDVADFVTFDLRQIGQGIAIALALIAAGFALFKRLPQLGEQLIRDQAHSLAFLRHRFGWEPIIALSLCAGISEEALFRAGMLTLAGEYAPVWLALIGSSGLFALIHFAKLRVALFIFAIGCLFGLLYLALESLLAVMIAHSVYDIWAIWYVQNEMHRLGVFDEPGEPEPQPLG